MSENELLHLFFRFAVVIVSLISFVNVVRWRSRAKGECKMDLIDESFEQESEEEVPVMPSEEELIKMIYECPRDIPDDVVEKMYRKYPDDFSDDVVNVIYSKDRSMRYVIEKYKEEFYTYKLEEIYCYGEDEWFSDDFPATWETAIRFREDRYLSIFKDVDSLLREIKAQPVYKNYFE